MSSDAPAIEVRNASKAYQIYARPLDRLKQFVLPRLQRWCGLRVRSYHQEFAALADVSLDIRRGETVGVIGRNGAGKSTLLQLICGTLYPTSGSVETHGRVAALLELGTGFNPEFSGRDNVFLNASVLGLSRAEIEERFASIERFADIGEFIDRPVKTYSSGMLVRLAFAVVAHVDADILVIDEALAVGDAFFTRKCMRFLREFMDNGTILFVSHDIGSVKALCNRVVWVDHGRVVEQGPTREVCAAYLEACFAQDQGPSVTPRPARTPAPRLAARDQRDKFINASNLRNDIRVFKFDPESASFGRGQARITHVSLTDDEGSPLSWVVGGEAVSLVVHAECFARLDTPIIGFTFKDRLGQPLFGDNTFLSHIDEPVACEAGERLVGRFEFDMPRLPVGEYSMIVAIADGTQADNIQHHWMHDALRLRSETSSVASGMVGIPMRAIRLERAD
jgi:lipopolysaccharide transport system ATP-binding protein